MSLSYRITLRESRVRVLRAEDEVSTTMDLLGILPAEQMADLVRRAWLERGFVEQPNGTLQLQQRDTKIVVNPQDGKVTVTIHKERITQQTAEEEVIGYSDMVERHTVQKGAAQEQLLRKLEKKFETEHKKLQKETADQLERALLELQPQVDAVTNQVLREAVKIKASQMGQIQEIHEDSATGELIIKLEL